LGDQRVRNANSLVTLIEEAFPGSSVSAETGVVTMSGPARAVAEEASGFFYAAFVLSPSARERMLKDLTRLLADQSTGQVATFNMPISRIVADVSERR
ncbi:MAG: hypothetical protein KGY54_13480, partial [Oleiphilaceae bacterium]|nr:hypothetical protein [Oleiphilaceae bacterium]